MITLNIHVNDKRIINETKNPAVKDFLDAKTPMIDKSTPTTSMMLTFYIYGNTNFNFKINLMCTPYLHEYTFSFAKIIFALINSNNPSIKQNI